MRHRSAAFIALLLSTSGVARAEGKDRTDAPVLPEDAGALGVFTGALTFVTGFAVGGVLIARSGESSPGRARAGWLTIESGFVFAPIAAHAVTSEWTRGFAFAAAPASALGGSAAVFAVDPRAVRHAPLSGQRVLWGLFSVGMLVSTAGVVDAAFADARASSFMFVPNVGPHEAGLEIGGAL